MRQGLRSTRAARPLREVLASALAAASLAACGPATPPPVRGTGAVQVAALAGSGGPSLTRVHVQALPSGAAADLTLDSGAWRGTLTVPAGVPQTLTAVAYAGADAVGAGSATITVAQHATGLATIAILDATGRPSGADHGPIIAAVTSSAAPVHGTPVSLAVSAVDPDGDALEYAWGASCGGAFSAAAAAATDWTPSTVGGCTLTVAVRSRELERTSTLPLTVSAPVPALTIVEDESYPLANDPRSTYPYRADSADYATLSDTATTVFGTTDKHVRLVRYVVSNPGARPVAIAPIIVSGAWWLSEQWDQQSPAVGGGDTALGTTCPSLAAEEYGYVLTPACAVGEVYAGDLGADSAEGLCESDLDSGTTIIPSMNAAIGRAVTLDASGVEGGPAPKMGARTVVPAASGGVPGRIALYLSRPLVSRSYPATWTGTDWTFLQTVWRKTSVPPGPMECPEGWDGEWDSLWDLYLRPQRLEAADDVLTGFFVLTAYATDGTAVIGPATPLATVTFTRIIGH